MLLLAIFGNEIAIGWFKGALDDTRLAMRGRL